MKMALLLGALAAWAAGARAAAPDVALPWNPLDSAVAGDWARYRVLDPHAPDDRAPTEIFTVKTVEDATVVVADTAGAPHRYARGEAGKSAIAFLRGFLGERGADQLDGLAKLAVTPDPVDGHPDAVRLDAVISAKLPEGGAEHPLDVELHVWLSPGVKAGGVARATIAVRYADREHGSTLELGEEGKAGDRPKKAEAPEAPTGTAAPK
jgi:hypothetical protein